MNKLIVLSGVPGSGKSYFSNAVLKVMGSHVYVVSSDELRVKMTGSQSDLSKDKLMWKIFYSLAKVYSQDPDAIVILDATNFDTKRRVDATKDLKPLFNEIDLVSFEIDPLVASNQNLQREHPIAPEVLNQFFKVFEKPNQIDEAYFDHVVIIKNNDIAKAIDMIQQNNQTINIVEMSQK